MPARSGILCAGAWCVDRNIQINFAESPLKLVELMRGVIENELSAAEAVMAYHDHLAKIKITPDLALAQDIEITDPVLK